MASGSRFEWHSHERHQLAWAASGVLTVVAEAGTWVLPPTRALWIPAGVCHETIASETTTMRTLYLQPRLCPIRWPGPQPVLATKLLGDLIEHLADETLEPAARGRAEGVVFDLLQPAAISIIQVTMPTDPRALDVAQALTANPADRRPLSAWGREVGASARTLTRVFVNDTGVTFTRWRTALRLQAALPQLAAREPVANVASRVGYENSERVRGRVPPGNRRDARRLLQLCGGGT